MFEGLRRRPSRSEEEQLIDSGVLDGSERQVERNLAVQAFRGTKGGIPSRNTGSFHLGYPVRDLTTTEHGRATLERLDAVAREGLQALAQDGSSTNR